MSARSRNAKRAERDTRRAGAHRATHKAASSQAPSKEARRALPLG
jgi:hypothetical protein